MGHCQRCGICVEVCPFDALEWVAQPAPSEVTTDALRHDTEQLAAAADDKSSGNTADDSER